MKNERNPIVLPGREHLPDEELGKLNIRGYAALVQKILKMESEDLRREGKELDPLKTIGVLNKRDLVEGVEIALRHLPLRNENAIRLAYGLDQADGEFTTQKNIGIEIGAKKEQKPITDKRAAQLINFGLGKLRQTRCLDFLKMRLWGDK